MTKAAQSKGADDHLPFIPVLLRPNSSSPRHLEAMNDTPTTLPEVIAYLTARCTAGTNLSSSGEHQPHKNEVLQPVDHAGIPADGVDPLPAQNPLSQTQILHLLELGLANPSKQEDRR